MTNFNNISEPSNKGYYNNDDDCRKNERGSSKAQNLNKEILTTIYSMFKENEKRDNNRPSLLSSVSYNALQANHQEFSRLISFKNFLFDNLPSESLQFLNLSDFNPRNNLSLQANLKEVSLSIRIMKTNIIETLITLQENDLNRLEMCSKEQNKLKLFQDAFVLARLCKSVKLAMNIFDPYKKAESLEEIYTSLYLSGENTIRDNNEKGTALWWMFVTLMESNEIDKAIEGLDNVIEFVEALPDYDFQKKERLFMLSCTLFDNGKDDKALKIIDKLIEVVNAMPDHDDNSGIDLKQISDRLMNRNIIDKAIEVANAIPIHSIRNLVLLDLFSLLNMQRDVEHVKKVVNHIMKINEIQYFHKLDTLKKITTELNQSGLLNENLEVVDKLIEVANTIDDDDLRRDAIEYLVSLLIEIGMADWAQEVKSGMSKR